MGFAPVAAVAILLIGGLASFTGYTIAHDAAQDELRRASREAAAGEAQRTLTAMTVSSATYQNGPNRLTLNVVNSGSAVIATQDIDVVIDGVLSTHMVTYIRVGGSSDAYWAPLEVAEIRVDSVTSKPARVAVVAQNGASVYTGVA